MRATVFCILFFCFAGFMPAGAQVCTGQLGDPLIRLDFGAGSALYGGPLPAENTGYTYVQSDNVPEGSYTVVRTTPVMGTLWWVTRDHTDNGGGYMLLVNSTITPSPYFYQRKISGLCPNTKYELAAWIMNLLVASDNSPPNLSIVVETASATFTYDTGIIPKEDRAVWKQYGFVFTTPPGGGDVTVKIRNNSPGAPGGNDFAMDDLTLRACGPLVVAGIGDERRTDRAICTGENATLYLSSTQPAGYANPSFQWQVSTGNGWQDIPGSTTPATTVTFNNIVIGSYIYRLKVWEGGTSPFCGIVSNEININVVEKPVAQLGSNSPVCPGTPLILTCQGSSRNTYSWTGPGGFTSTDQNPVIPDMSPARAGVYRVTVTTGGACSTVNETTVVVKPSPVLNAGSDVVICEGQQTTLHATGGETYTWKAAPGLTDLRNADPVVSPTETTTYTVSTSNGTCLINDDVKVTVVKNALANAGNDKKVLSGNSVVLEGSSSQPGSSHYWTPAVYLDDATKLNPVCTPLANTVYTLHVTGPGGCTVSTDEMSIRVLEPLVFRSVFTPNGDGINDIWNIGGLTAYPGNRVQIYNRYGTRVFESRGYGTPWNGTLNGRDLPGGTYYYVIELPSENSVEKGSVTLMR